MILESNKPSGAILAWRVYFAEKLHNVLEWSADMRISRMRTLWLKWYEDEGNMVLETIIRELFLILVYIRGKGGSLLRFVLYSVTSFIRTSRDQTIILRHTYVRINNMTILMVYDC